MRAIVLGLAVLLAGCETVESKNLAKCETALMATLKSPASYKRVKVERVTDTYFRISYDAVNSFNAPIRGDGTCSVDAGGGANWYEIPKT